MVEQPIDINLIPLDRLDREAQKVQRLKELAEQKEQSEKILSRGKSPLEYRLDQDNPNKGGIFGGSVDKGVKGSKKRRQVSGAVSRKRDRTSSQAIQKESNFEVIRDQMNNQSNMLRQILESDLGTGKANQFLGLAKNPVGFMTNMFTRTLPILGGILAAKDIALFIMDELTRRGGVFDLSFRERVQDEYNALRKKEHQQSIRSGFSQLIIADSTGSISAKTPFNTYEIKRNNDLEQINYFAIRRGN
ncbi:MAG: hypothetical protein MAG458_00688 [Nitrosopumilus sp.]|nr:hypothetical protein [Nitrosopumilus sp.]